MKYLIRYSLLRGGNNKGLVWGIYSYIEEDIVEVNWFKTEEERDKIFLERKE